MESLRLLFPLLLGHFACALPLSGVDTEKDLKFDCVNDFEDKMSCQFAEQNCSGYSLTLELTSETEQYLREGNFQQCNPGLCCCDVTVRCDIYGESYDATVWKGGKQIVSKDISVTESIKPKPPTIVSVKESDGNFEVLWKSNVKYITHLSAEVTYNIKGDSRKMVFKAVEQHRKDGLWFYEIIGRQLEPRTTYVVSVKTCTSLSDKCSESSPEWEFKTLASRSGVSAAIIVSLSLVAAATCAAIFVCYVKVRTNVWDKYSNKKPLTLSTCQSSKTAILKVEQLKTSALCIEPPSPDVIKDGSKLLWGGSEGSGSLQSSGISTGSSHLSYAETEPPDVIAAVQNALKALNISPASPNPSDPFKELNTNSVLVSSSYNPCNVRAEGTSSGSSSFSNGSYFNPTVVDPPEGQIQSEMPCDPEYHLNRNNATCSPDSQVFPCPFPAQPDVPCPVQTVMSYQPCSADLQRCTDSEGCSVPSSSGGTAATVSPEPEFRVGDPLPSCAAFSGFIEMDDDYRPIKGQAEEMEVVTSDGTSGDHMKNWETFPAESFNTTSTVCSSLFSPHFISDEVQSPFSPMMPDGQSPPIITDSGYQSV